jgi:Telomere recombination
MVRSSSSSSHRSTGGSQQARNILAVTAGTARTKPSVLLLPLALGVWLCAVVMVGGVVVTGAAAAAAGGVSNNHGRESSAFLRPPAGASRTEVKTFQNKHHHPFRAAPDPGTASLSPSRTTTASSSRAGPKALYSRQQTQQRRPAAGTTRGVAGGGAAVSAAVASGRTLHIQIAAPAGADDGIDEAWKTMEIVPLLDAGGVGVLPTDTGYCLATRMDSKRGTERLLRILSGGGRGAGLKSKKDKARPQQQQLLSLLCSNLATVDEYCSLYSLPKRTFKVLKKNLPGPYTFLMHPNKHALRHIGGGGGVTVQGGKLVYGSSSSKENIVGIRIPADPVLRHFQDELYGGVPLLASALPVHTNDDDEYDSDDDDSSVPVGYINTLRTLFDRAIPSSDGAGSSSSAGCWWWDSVDFVVDVGPLPVDGATVFDLTGSDGDDPALIREGLGDANLAM